MLNLFKKKGKEENETAELRAILSGKVIPITEVNDEVFSSKMLGDGIAFKPESGTVVAPADGEISVVMEGSNHAVGIKLSNGYNFLIHVGIDTVSMNGEGFTCYVKMGEKVKAGAPLIKFDKALIEEKGYCADTMLIACEEGTPMAVNFLSGMQAVAGETVVASW